MIRINYKPGIFTLSQGALFYAWLSLASVQAATNCAQVTEIPQAECEELITLYEQTDGPNWRDSPDNHWNITNEPCSWQGVNCED